MKKSKLLPLLLAPLLLVGCSDGELINSSAIYEWIKKDVEVFKSLNAKNDKDELITIPYSKDLFVTYVTVSTDENGSENGPKTYESNYELGYEATNDKIMLNINNNEENKFENIDNYIELVKLDEAWTIDETLSSVENHDYYAYQEIAFNEDANPYGQTSGTSRVILNVYQKDSQMVIAFWKQSYLEYTAWPEVLVNTYFNLETNKNLTNFVPFTGANEGIQASYGMRSGYPIIDLTIKTNNQNAIKDYISTLEAKSYQKEDYHQYMDSLDCYYLNQSYEFKEPGKKDPSIVLQSLNVFLDREVGQDNQFNIRLEVQETVELD